MADLKDPPGGVTGGPRHERIEDVAPEPPDREGLPTGEGTSAVHDVADPHPQDEEHYEAQRHPGGAHPPKDKPVLAEKPHDGSLGQRPHGRAGAPE
jgi:hypothetical protein